MRLPAARKNHPLRTEQIILFRSSGQVFAISAGSVQEVRGVDGMAAAAIEISEPRVPKVRHLVRRTERTLYVVNAALHFGLKPSPAGLLFMIRKSRVALLVDTIEKMSTMTCLQGLPRAFCHEERNWYRGITVLEQNVVPVVNPDGFLTSEELWLLDIAAEHLNSAATAVAHAATDEALAP